MSDSGIKKKIESFEAYVILNYAGLLWSRSNFYEKKEAERYLTDFWRPTMYDKSVYKIIKVKITVEAC